MNYLVKFNLTKEKNVNGNKSIEYFPISYKACNVSSKEEAAKKTLEAFSNFYLENNNLINKYYIEIVDMQRVPEDAPTLDVNYHNLYKDAIFDLVNNSNFNDKGQANFEGKNGLKGYIRKSKYTDGDESIIIYVRGGTTFRYDKNSDTISFDINPNTDPRGSAMGYLIINYKKDNNVSFVTYGYNGNLSNLPIEDALTESYRDDGARRSSLNDFLGALPQFSKEEILKRQEQIQEEYAKQFYEEQLKLIREEESKEILNTFKKQNLIEEIR